MKVTSFHHVSVNRNDAPLDEMVSFYGDLLGLDAKERPEIPGVPGHWFAVADQELHVDKAIAELEDRNIPYERAVQGAGTVQIWINDPAGNTIELQQDRAAGRPH